MTISSSIFLNYNKMSRQRAKQEIGRFDTGKASRFLSGDENSLFMQKDSTKKFLESFNSEDQKEYHKFQNRIVSGKYQTLFNELYLRQKKYINNLIIYLVNSYEPWEISQLFKKFLMYINFELILNNDYSQLGDLIITLSNAEFLKGKKLRNALIVYNVDIKKSMLAFFQEGSEANRIDQKVMEKLKKKWSSIQLPLLLSAFFEFEQHIFLSLIHI